MSSLFLLPETPDLYTGDEVLKSIVDMFEDVLIEPVGSSYEAYLNIYNGLIDWDYEDINDDEELQMQQQNIKKKDLRKEMFVEDYYALLGIQDLSWRATQDEIKKAYKKMVIIHHPDKQGGDERTFKMISTAYEKLSDPSSRLAYDSSQPFNDTLPSLSQVKSDFYGSLTPVFIRNQKFSTKESMPEFGDDNTDITQVFAFYEAWYGFSSWRDFSHLDEYDPDEFDSREEKRWVERKNNKQRSKKLKEEKGRISKLVNMAYQNDPRIVRHKEEEKVRRIEAKKQRAIDARLRKEETERKKAELKKQKEEAELERLKQVMEQQQREAEERADILEKKKIKLRSFCEHFEYDSERAEFIIENLEFDSFIDLFTSFKKKKKKEVFEILDEQYKLCSSGPHSDVNDIWTKDELTILSKAVVQYPGGIPNRWDRIYEVLGGSKSKEAIIKKVKNAAKVKQNTSNKLAQQYEQSKGGENIVSINLEVKDEVADWDPSEQAALEEALLKYPSALGKARWEGIASEVPGRSKKECVERYKYILSIIKKTRGNKN